MNKETYDKSLKNIIKKLDNRYFNIREQSNLRNNTKKYIIEYTFSSNKRELSNLLTESGLTNNPNINIDIRSNETYISFNEESTSKPIPKRIPRKEYMKIISEYCNMDHTETRKVMLNLNEVDQEDALYKLTNRLYDSITDKASSIDFGDIPKSNGDITKLENYKELVESLALVHDIVIRFKQDPEPVNIIMEAVDNVRTRKDKFEAGFRTKSEMIMLMYNTIVLACISTTSFMISCCINFVKQPGDQTFKISVDRTGMEKTKGNLMLHNLEKWNDACKKGQVDNTVDYILKNTEKNLLGYGVGVVAGGVALVGLILAIIPILRELIYLFFYARTTLSDYFDLQAQLLEINANNIDFSGSKADQKKKKEIYDRQMKIVNTFKRISDFFLIKMNKSEKEATKDIMKDNKLYQTDDLFDSLPDSGASALF